MYGGGVDNRNGKRDKGRTTAYWSKETAGIVAAIIEKTRHQNRQGWAL